MKKVTFVIDGNEYKALFHTVEEIASFMEDNREDGSTIAIIGYCAVTPAEILKHSLEFEWSYVVEMVFEELFPDIAHDYSKWTYMEQMLQKLGYIK